MAKNGLKQHNKLFFCQKGKKAMADDRSPPQELEVGPRSVPYLLVTITATPPVQLSGKCPGPFSSVLCTCLASALKNQSNMSSINLFAKDHQTDFLHPLNWESKGEESLWARLPNWTTSPVPLLLLSSIDTIGFIFKSLLSLSSGVTSGWYKDRMLIGFPWAPVRICVSIYIYW